MISKNTAFTIGSKFIILLANFALVVFTTQTWGSDGRGEIALVIANISIISIFSSVFCGSTVAYHTPRLDRNSILSVSFLGAIIVSLSGALVFTLIFGKKYFLPFFLIALLNSLTTAISIYWLGKSNFKHYNLLLIITPLFIGFSLAALYFLLNKTSIDSYFEAYYIGMSIVLIIGAITMLSRDSDITPHLSFEGVRSIFNYGFSNEFNYLIQFINYRLSYYFIAKILGLSQLGVFSIVVSISEAVWIISRSMSVIHYSNVINSDDQIKNRSETKVYVRQSFWISISLLAFSVFLPDSLYRFIFGEEFGVVKKYILYLMPGIMAIAVSNLYGNYFAGKGKLNIVRKKSLIGLGVTILLLPILIKQFQLTGVCISLNASYIASSFYLWYQFRKEDISTEPAK